MTATDTLVVLGVGVAASVVWLTGQVGAWAFVVGRSNGYQAGRTLLRIFGCVSPFFVLAVTGLRHVAGADVSIWDYLIWPGILFWLLFLSYAGLKLAVLIVYDGMSPEGTDQSPTRHGS